MMKTGILVSIILILLALNGFVIAIQFDEIESVESEIVESKAVENETMDTSDCVTLCNFAFTRADERLFCHEQCHEKFD